MRRTIMRNRLLLATLVTFVAVTASAQEMESVAGVKLIFDRAGARSLAMGSTVAAADDASSASSNPAILAGARRSFSIEGRRQTSESRYINDERLNTIGVKSTANGIRSASVTLPMARATWAFFYEQPLEVHRSNASVLTNARTGSVWVCNGRVAADPCSAAAVYFRFPGTYPLDVSLRLRGYGISLARTLGPLALGASVRYEHFRQASAFDRALFYPPHPGTMETTDDSAITYTVGATPVAASSRRAPI